MEAPRARRTARLRRAQRHRPAGLQLPGAQWKLSAPGAAGDPYAAAVRGAAVCARRASRAPPSPPGALRGCGPAPHHTPPALARGGGGSAGRAEFAAASDVRRRRAGGLGGRR